MSSSANKKYPKKFKVCLPEPSSESQMEQIGSCASIRHPIESCASIRHPIESCASIRHPMQKETSWPTQEEDEEEGDEAESSLKSKRTRGKGNTYPVCGFSEKRLPQGIKEFLPSNGGPYFVTKLRANISNELTIPRVVRKDFGLKFGESIELQDPKGRFWTGRIRVTKQGKVSVEDVWRRLCWWNKAAMDDWLICEFLPNHKPTCEVIKVQVIHPKDLKRQTNS